MTPVPDTYPAVEQTATPPCGPRGRRHRRLITAALVGVGMLGATVSPARAVPVPGAITTTVGPNGDGTIGVYGAAAPVVSPNGDLYFANQLYHNVVRRTPSGTLSVVAGPAVAPHAAPAAPGFSGDGGAATSALLFLPAGLALDGAGNLYIADQGNHRVRKVSPGTDGVVNGGAGETISTVAGSGACAGPCTSAEYTAGKLHSPSGVAVRGSDVYIADYRNATVRKLSGGTLSTVAGTPLVGGFSGDGGLATSAKLRKPAGVTVDGSKLFITDQGNHNVRLVNLIASGGSSVTAAGITAAPGNIDTVAGCSAPGLPPAQPVCGTHIAPGGVIYGAGYAGDLGPARSAQLNWPFSTDVDSDGNLYISDENNHRVRVVDPNGVISTYAGIGVGPCSTVWNPLGVIGSPVDCSTGYDTVDTAGTPIPALLAPLGRPRGVAVDPTNEDRLYVADFGNSAVRMVTRAL